MLTGIAPNLYAAVESSYMYAPASSAFNHLQYSKYSKSEIEMYLHMILFFTTRWWLSKFWDHVFSFWNIKLQKDSSLQITKSFTIGP